MQRSMFVILVVLLLFGSIVCEAERSAHARAGDEMKEGYKAARHGYWQEALMRFERADELEPGQARILNNIAVALEAVGRFDEAAEVYEKALAIDPGNDKLTKNHRLAKEFYETNIANTQAKADEADAEEGDDEVEEEGDDDA